MAWWPDMIWRPATSLTSASTTWPSSCLSHSVLSLVFKFISMLMQALGFCHFLCLECSSPRYLHDFGPLSLNLCSNFVYYQRGFFWPFYLKEWYPSSSCSLPWSHHHLTDFIPSLFPPISIQLECILLTPGLPFCPLMYPHHLLHNRSSINVLKYYTCTYLQIIFMHAYQLI